MKKSFLFVVIALLSLFLSNSSQSQILTANAGADQTICSGNSATIGDSPTATGGTAPYHYQWSPSATLNNDTLANPSALPITTTTYTVTVTDALSNTATDNVTITVNPLPVASDGNDQTICAGNCAYLNATGGISYQWSPAAGLSSTTIPNPVACPATNATYIVWVTDANGCSASDDVAITVVPNPIVTVTATTYTICQGGCTTLTASGGTTYVWSNGVMGSIITACPVTTTTYYLTVTNSVGCSGSGSVTIVVGNLNIGLSSTNSSCNLCNGSITASVLGGTPPYNYAWSNGTTVPIITGICAGAYTVTVTDMTGCMSTNSVTVNNVNDVSVVLDSLNNANCSNNTAGSITVHGDCGAGGYSYVWSNNATTASINNLPAGNYTVTINDINGNTATATFPVSNTPNIYASMTVSNTNCGNNGAATVQAYGDFPPFTYYWSDALHQTTATASNLMAGTYYVTITDSLNCTFIATANVLPLGCMNIIKGRVYLDTNQNCIQDIGEAGIPNATIYASPGYYYGSTNASGDFTIATPNMYNVLHTPNLYQSYYSLTCPSSGIYNINFSQQGDTSLANDFGYYSNPNYFDLGIHPGWSGGNPGFTKTYWVLYNNSSPTPQNALIRFEYDSLLQYTGCTQGGVHYPAQHKIEWTFNNLAPGSYWDWTNKPEAYFNVPTTVSINTLLHTCFEILPIIGDANPSDNTLCADEVVTGSHDPNSKTVSPVGIGTEGYISPNDSVLLYTIHFQNDGNDTAFTVVVVDTLSPYLDPATVIPGAASHPYSFELSGQGIVTFRFNNILLPDSNVNEPASNGYVNFLVKQKPNNPDGTVIYNTAANYFDFNEPVNTNTVRNTISTSLGIINETTDAKNILSYPNPFTDKLTINIKEKIQTPYTLRIFNELSELVFATTAVDPIVNINTGKWGDGFYYFTALDANGKLIGAGKLIK